MSPELAARVVEGLKEADISFFTFLPDSRLTGLIPAVEKEESFTVVRAGHEGSAVNMACGAALVGKNAAAYMEGTGLMASLYQLQCVSINSGIPILLLVSYIGSPGDRGNSSTFSGFGMRLEPLLQAMGIQYLVLEDDYRLEIRIVDMARAALAAKQPACLLFTGDFTAVQRS